MIKEIQSYSRTPEKSHIGKVRPKKFTIGSKHLDRNYNNSSQYLKKEINLDQNYQKIIQK